MRNYFVGKLTLDPIPDQGTSLLQNTRQHWLRA